MKNWQCTEELGSVFEIGKEVVVYHSNAEAKDLLRYYLDHDDERREIAIAGFQRVMRDYTNLTTFGRAVDVIKGGMREAGITHFKDGSPNL